MRVKILTWAVLAFFGIAGAQDTETDAVENQPAQKTEAAADKPARLFDRGMMDINQPITITSERFEFDYKQMVAVFDTDVKVVHPQFYMEADQVFVFITDTKPADVKNILAQGSVVMTNEGNSATCDWALYTRAEGTLVLRGKDGDDAHLTHDNHTARGPEIVFSLENETMTIEGGTGFTFIPNAAKKNTDAQEEPETPAGDGETEEAQLEKPRPAPLLYVDPEGEPN